MPNLRLLLASLVAAIIAAAGSVFAVAPAVAESTPAACSSPQTGEIAQTMQVGDLTRSYDVFLPPSWDGSKKMAVVYLFHGLYADMSGALWAAKLPDKAAADGFVVVVPQGIGKGSLHDWEPDIDAPFITALQEKIAHDYCIDTTRQYAVGYSAGSKLTQLMACYGFGGFAGYAGAAGSIWWDGCPNRSGFNFIGFHGTDDPYAPFNGNGYDIPSVQWSKYAMAQTDGCATEDPNSITQFTARTTKYTWNNCTAGHRIDVYVTAGAGHVWPGADDWGGGIGPQADISAVDILSSSWHLAYAG